MITFHPHLMRTRYVGTKVMENPCEFNEFSCSLKKDFSVFYDHVVFLMMQGFILLCKDLFLSGADDKKKKNFRQETEKHDSEYLKILPCS